MSHYDRLPLGHAEKNYNYLISLVRRHLEARRRDQVRDEHARHRGQPAYAATSPGPKREQGECWQWIKHGKCSKSSECPFIHNDKHAGRGGRPPQGGGRGRSTSPRSSRSNSSSRERRSSREGREKTSRPITPPRNSPRRTTPPPRRTPSNEKKAFPASPGKTPGSSQACFHFQKTGTCKFGDKCRYVHVSAHVATGSTYNQPKQEPEPEHIRERDRSTSVNADGRAALVLPYGLAMVSADRTALIASGRQGATPAKRST